jgi:hypothetical protein
LTGQPPIPRFCRVKEVHQYCTIYGQKRLVKMIQGGVIRGGRLPESESKKMPWFVDLKSLFEHIEGLMPSAATEKAVDNYLRRVG